MVRSGGKSNTYYSHRMRTEIQQTTWIFVVMGNVYDIKTGEWRSDAHILIGTQELWFAVFMTVL